MTIRVIVVDEFEIMRQGVKLILEQVPTIKVVGDAGSDREAVEVTAFVRPDVVVVDSPNLDVIRRLKEQCPAARVLAFSTCAEPAFVISALQAGANAYILKQSQSMELVRAVLALGRGDVFQPIIDAKLNLQVKRELD